MTEIFPHLYLGGLDVATAQFIQSNQIENILTIDTEVPELNWKLLKVQHKHIQITDEESSLIFPYFPTITDWLIKSLHLNQNSLVHCRHGVSRSATIVTAVLMKLLNISCEEAITKIKERHGSACPNPGFINQLKLWQILQYKIKLSHPNYRLFEFVTGYTLKPSDQEESLQSEEISKPEFGFKCCKCRKLLFTNRDILPHEARWWHHFSQQIICHKSYSILPQPWMNIKESVYHEKLVCSCNNKLGTIYTKVNVNVLCPCGVESESPVIQINPSRVDKFIMR